MLKLAEEQEASSPIKRIEEDHAVPRLWWRPPSATVRHHFYKGGEYYIVRGVTSLIEMSSPPALQLNYYPFATFHHTQL